MMRQKVNARLEIVKGLKYHSFALWIYFFTQSASVGVRRRKDMPCQPMPMIQVLIRFRMRREIAKEERKRHHNGWIQFEEATYACKLE